MHTNSKRRKAAYILHFLCIFVRLSVSSVHSESTASSLGVLSLGVWLVHKFQPCQVFLIFYSLHYLKMKMKMTMKMKMKMKMTMKMKMKMKMTMKMKMKDSFRGFIKTQQLLGIVQGTL